MLSYKASFHYDPRKQYKANQLKAVRERIVGCLLRFEGEKFSSQEI